MTALILRRGLMYGLEARLIYCWTICCNSEGRLIVAIAALVLSRKRGICQGVDLDVYSGEGRGDGFVEDLSLATQRSLRCFRVIKEILKKSCVVDGNTLGGAAMYFGLGNLGSWRVGLRLFSYCGIGILEILVLIDEGYCWNCSEEEALENMELICDSDLRVIVSDGNKEYSWWLVLTLQLNLWKLIQLCWWRWKLECWVCEGTNRQFFQQ